MQFYKALQRFKKCTFCIRQRIPLVHNIEFVHIPNMPFLCYNIVPPWTNAISRGYKHYADMHKYIFEFRYTINKFLLAALEQC